MAGEGGSGGAQEPDAGSGDDTASGGTGGNAGTGGDGGTGTGGVAGTGGSGGASPPGAVLWEADTARGTGVFEGLEEKPGTISVVEDPLGVYGKVFNMHIETITGYYKDRCETRGCRKADNSIFRMNNGSEYFIGWRSMWDPLPVSTWLAVFQIHGYGDTGCHAPLVLRTLNDGKLWLQHQEPSGAEVDLWSTSLELKKWHTFVAHFKLTDKPADALLEFWYDGKQQMFKGGVMKYPAALWNCAWVNVKWGIYRHTTPGAGNAYMSRARIGTSFDAVDPTKP